ncbi:unnamed protein product [Coregonus sp. 'balchen']|nr:unnamed protein product [Coregonus sp. 'balchen']
MACPFHQSAELNPALLPLDWLLGVWESDEPGEGSFSSIPPFRYTETLHFSHVGQPIINFITSFAKEPHVQQISRVFQLRPEGKLEQTVSMAMEGGPLMQHLHITYRRSS